MKTSKTIMLVLVLAWIPTVARADFREMSSLFQVSISGQEEYTDNVNLTSQDRRSDFITTLSPRLKFSTLPRAPKAAGGFRAPTGEENFGMNADYQPGFVFYAHTGRNYVSHNGTMDAFYIWDKSLTFRVREYLIRTENPREPDFSQTAIPGQNLPETQRNRSIYTRNVFEPSLEYKFGTENLLTVSYRNNIYNNQSRTSSNSRENYFSPQVSYWFDIRNGISLQYALDLGHFQGSPDLVGHNIIGRYTYRLDPKISFYGEYTFLIRDFDTPVQKLPVPIFPPPEPPSLDYVVHNPTVGVEYTFSKTVSGKAGVGYFWQIPDQGSQKSGPSYNVSLNMKGEKTTLTFSYRGGYYENFFTVQNTGFTKSQRGIGVVKYQLTDKATLTLTGTLDRTESASNQRETLWEVDGNISYQLLSWLNLSLRATHRRDDSNVSSLGYTENRGVFSIVATY